MCSIIVAQSIFFSVVVNDPFACMQRLKVSKYISASDPHTLR
jgi:hypothetical protein